MTTISANVVCDSVNPYGKRIVTLELRYPRWIHAEFMTHRVFSRNASSSRAVPVERMIAEVTDDPAVPLHWGKNQKGMQAREEADARVDLFYGGEIAKTRGEAWLMARDMAVDAARAFAKAGYHKQIVNRLLEPFAHISVVVTATEWDNFFALRCHPDAEPHIQMLARAMQRAMASSEPRELNFGEWHLPYFKSEEGVRLLVKDSRLVSAARCARVSYLNHDGSKADVESDLKLAYQLMKDGHWSPFEHQATPAGKKSDPALNANFIGWAQSRQVLEAEGRK